MKQKLSDLIKELTKVKKEYKDTFGKEPYIWTIEIEGLNEVAKIELCHSVRKVRDGLCTTASDVQEYTIYT